MNVPLEINHQESVAQLAETAINVKSFGAKAFTIANDTLAIVKALSVVNNNGGILYFQQDRIDIHRQSR